MVVPGVESFVCEHVLMQTSMLWYRITAQWDLGRLGDGEGVLNNSSCNEWCWDVVAGCWEESVSWNMSKNFDSISVSLDITISQYLSWTFWCWHPLIMHILFNIYNACLIFMGAGKTLTLWGRRVRLVLTPTLLTIEGSNHHTLGKRKLFKLN